MHNTNVIFSKSEGGLAKIDWKEVGNKFSVKDLKNKYGLIKSLSDVKLSRSDRKKTKQELVLSLVNENSVDLKFNTYKELENYLKLSPELREFVKVLRDALTGMASMMEPYVDKGITFESWSSIVSSREMIKNHEKAKAEAIRQAAMIFRKTQDEWRETTIEMRKNIPMEGLIDTLTAEALPQNVKLEIARLAAEPEIIADKTKNALRKFKADEVKKFELQGTSYELPDVK